MIRIIILSITITILSCSKNTISDKEQIINILNAYKNAKSINYKINYYQKYFDGDSVRINADVELSRYTNDTIVGGKLWYKVNDSMMNAQYDKYYDLNLIYEINHKRGMVTSYKAHQGEDFILNGNTDVNLKNTYFFNADNLLKKIESGSTPFTFNKNKHVIKLTQLIPDDDPYTNMERTIYFDIENKSISKATFQATFQNQIQYNEFNFKNVVLSDINSTEEKLEKKLKGFLNIYPLKEYIPKTKEDYALIPLNNTIPNFTGKEIKTNIEINISDELKKSELLLLDFWYMSCYPCLKSMPDINKLFLKYKDDGFNVIGLNHFDQNIPKEKMTVFLKENTMSYSSLFVDRNVIEKMNITAYPTLYLIDKNSKVVYSHIGIAPYRKLDSIISNKLNL